MTRLADAAVLVLLVLGTSCATFAPDGARTKNAVDAAKAIPDPTKTLDPDKTEARGYDGSTYKIVQAGAGGICVVVTVANDHDDADKNQFRLRLFGGDPGGSPLYERDGAELSVVRNYTVQQTGGVPTDQYVRGSDGQLNNIVQVGNVDFPVTDLKACFAQASVSAGVRYMVVNKVPASDRQAPSYVAWRIDR